jgi:glycosyltransferase involved in cell wall biosynthesis
MPRATFIIATYKRVDALRCALGSLILQDQENWNAIVVGDCCGDDTGAMIRELGDPRIRYYNLPQRFGEQSGPNNFGLHIADGDFIAFLNHDDVLLRDHLSHALDQLSSRRANFFIGRFANVTQLHENEAGAITPVATKMLPQTEDLSVLVQRNPYLFDPSSFWLTENQFAKSVGEWRPARTLWRTPLRDWIMRAWRLRAILCFGQKITGVRFWTQNLRRDAPLYSTTTPEHSYMLSLLQRESGDTIRAAFLKQMDQSSDDPVFNTQLMPWPKRKLLAVLYCTFGFDQVSHRGRRNGQPKGLTMNKISRKRTGDDLPPAWDMADVLRDPESCRVL